MNDITRFMKQLNHVLKCRGIDPYDLFEDYDSSKRGFISINYFQKALLSIRCSPTQNDLDSIYKRYGIFPSDFINYVKFCQDIDSFSSTQTLHKTVDQRDLIRLNSSLSIQGVDLYDILQKYDKTHKGIVTFSQFVNSFQGSNEAIKIAKSYVDNATQEINYHEIQNDLNKLGKTTFQKKTNSLPIIFTEFAKSIKTRRINYFDSFLTADKFKCGYLPRGMFLSILSSFNLPLSPSQLESLVIPFEQDENVDYKLFCSEIDKVKIIQQPQTIKRETITNINALLKNIQEIISSRHLNFSQQLNDITSKDEFYFVMNSFNIPLTESDKKALNNQFELPNGDFDVLSFLNIVDPKPINNSRIIDEIILDLKDHLKTVRIPLSRYFINFDREKSGTISVQQLNSALHAIKFNITVNELHEIVKHFQSGRLIDWKSLVKEVESPLETISTSYSPSKSKINNEIRDQKMIITLQKIYNLMKQKNVDLRSEFEKIDYQNLGVLKGYAFRRGLGILPLKLASEEICNLIQFYTESNQDYVQYTLFCNDLEKYGYTEPIKQQKPIQQQQHKETILEKQLCYAMKKVYTALVGKQMNVYELFERYDRTKSYKVPINVVSYAIRSLANYITQDDCDIIINRFKDERRPELFNYRKFNLEIYKIIPTNEEMIKIKESYVETNVNETKSVICSIKGRLLERHKLDVLCNLTGKNEISFDEFLDFFDYVGMGLSTTEYQTVFQNYRGKTLNTVNWLRFTNDLRRFDTLS